MKKLREKKEVMGDVGLKETQEEKKQRWNKGRKERKKMENVEQRWKI